MREVLAKWYRRGKALPGRINKKPCMVLLYHRVTNLKHDPMQLAVRPEYFEQHMKFLKKKYHVLSPEEFSFLLKEGKAFPPKSILITFDDGYEDNLLEALPIIESLEVPALFFITSAYLDNRREYWWDAWERMVFETTLLQKASLWTSIPELHWLSEYDFRDAETFFFQTHQRIKLQSNTQRDAFFEHLSRVTEEKLLLRASHKMMDKHQLKQFAENTMVTIGAHTQHHSMLSGQSPQEQIIEIQGSRQQLGNLLGKAPEYFAYPFGTSADYTLDSIAACKSSGFTMAFSNFPSFCLPSTDPYQIPRYLIRDWSMAKFSSFLSAMHIWEK